MRKIVRNFTALAGLCLSTAALPFFAKQQSAPGVPVSMIVTLEPRRGKTIPPLEAQDIAVSEGKDRRPVTGLVPLQGDRSGMQLLLLLDDSASSSIDTEISTLKKFVQSLPRSTQSCNWIHAQRYGSAGAELHG